MNASDFDFNLPPEHIAQFPTARREASRLLVYHRATKSLEHRTFTDLISYLNAGDVLVLNDSKVIRARLRGQNARSKGAFELLLLEEKSVNDWWAMVRPGRRAHLGTQIKLQDLNGNSTEWLATVVEVNPEGHRRLQFSGGSNLRDQLERLGEMPVPPYIRHRGRAELSLDADRYQTVYAAAPGSIAAPTAGLHFTAALLDDIRRLNVEIATITLHVGLGTFAPLKVEDLSEHVMHEEQFFLDDDALEKIATARARGSRIIPVGTTSLRTLESVASAHQGSIRKGSGRTRLFIHPPYAFQIADALVTNFHLPRSTLLMLVSAFAAPNQTSGTAEILRCYQEAIREGYRFYSYGDAMVIL